MVPVYWLWMVSMGAPLPFPEQPDIFLEIHGKGSGIVFLSPHENEHVPNEFLKERIRDEDARYAILRQRGERHVTLRISGRQIEVDPNRIFTPLGARASVMKLNPEGERHTLEEAAGMAYRLGRFILSSVGPLGEDSFLVAVHNNTDGYDGDGKGGVGTVSIKRYAARLSAGAGYLADVHVGEGDEDNLFFINRREDFEAMKRAGWHIALQHPRVATDPEEDDGSLSVFAEMIGCRYINIEAQRRNDDGSGRDHGKTQKKMIEFVLGLPRS